MKPVIHLIMITGSNNQMTVSVLTSLTRYEAYYVNMCIFHATITEMIDVVTTLNFSWGETCLHPNDINKNCLYMLVCNNQ